MTRHTSQSRTYTSSATLIVVLVLFLMVLAVRVQAQEPEDMQNVDTAVDPVATEVVSQEAAVLSERATQRAELDAERVKLRALRPDYLSNLQESETIPEPALSRMQRQQLQTYVDKASAGMRASLNNTQSVARDLTRVLERLGSERSTYAQSGIDALREVAVAGDVVAVDIVEFSNLANLMLRTDDPQVYMPDVRAYAELIASELELMRVAIFEAAELSRNNI